MPPSSNNGSNQSGKSSKHNRNTSQPAKVDKVQSRGGNTQRDDVAKRNEEDEKSTKTIPRPIADPAPASPQFHPASPPYGDNHYRPSPPSFGATGRGNFPQRTPPSNAVSLGGSPSGQGAYLYPQFSSSPPPGAAFRPLSHPTNTSGFDLNQHQQATMFKRFSIPNPWGPSPPPPHMAQQHFYGAPPLAGLEDNGTMRPGQEGFFCGLDSLENAGAASALKLHSVVVRGAMGSVEIQKAELNSVTVAELKGLRGAVIGAKILTTTSRSDPFAELRPLIAVVVHGPVIPKPTILTEEGMDEDRPNKVVGDWPIHHTEFQTTVEVYSLSRQKHIGTLYESPKTFVNKSIHNIVDLKDCPPVGQLTVDACGEHALVACGESGELFLFRPCTTQSDDGFDAYFKCVAKYWTTKEKRIRSLATQQQSQPGTQIHSTSGWENAPYDMPVYSLGERWLATVAPKSNTTTPFPGRAVVPENTKVPGLTSHAAPSVPSATSNVDMPPEEGLGYRVAKGSVQYAMKGVSWLGQYGSQAYNTWMGKEKQNGNVQAPQDMMDPSFPPTNSPQMQAANVNESLIVVLYDLGRLSAKERIKKGTAQAPFAVFEAPRGCSYLSFSPEGTNLLTVSKTGNDQYIFSIMAAAFSGRVPPYVKQVAHFERLSDAKVVNVAWEGPGRGNRLAILTENGTVHVHKFRGPQWPLPRTVVKKSSAPTSPNGSTSVGPIKVVDTARSAINALHSRSLSNTATSRPTISSITPYGAMAGRAVANGLGKAKDQGLELLHASDNKIKNVRGVKNKVSKASVKWSGGTTEGRILVIAGEDGQGRALQVQNRVLAEKNHLVVKPSFSFPIHSFKRLWCAEAIEKLLPPNNNDPPSEAHPHTTQATSLLPPPSGTWRLRTRRLSAYYNHLRRPSSGTTPLDALDVFELETNPPYQPFHTDRRVSLATYTEPGPSAHNEDVFACIQTVHHVDDDSAWVFGEPLVVMAAQTVGGSYAASTSNLLLDGDGGEGVGEGEEDEFPIDEETVAAFGEMDLAGEDGDGVNQGYGAGGGTGGAAGGVALGFESGVERVVDGEEEVERVVITTRRRKSRGKRENEGLDFEEDVAVVDYADEERG